jgi:hypothetical protein
LFGGFCNPPAGSAQAQWNTMMSKSKVRNIVRYWSFLVDFIARACHMKLFQSPVAKYSMYYVVIAPFLNNLL